VKAFFAFILINLIFDKEIIGQIKSFEIIKIEYLKEKAKL